MQRELPAFCLPADIVQTSFDPRIERAAGLCLDDQPVNTLDIAEAASAGRITVGEEADLAVLVAMSRQLEEWQHGG